MLSALTEKGAAIGSSDGTDYSPAPTSSEVDVPSGIEIAIVCAETNDNQVTEFNVTVDGVVASLALSSDSQSIDVTLTPQDGNSGTTGYSVNQGVDTTSSNVSWTLTFNISEAGKKTGTWVFTKSKSVYY